MGDDMKKLKREGFTLVELLAVITIIGIVMVFAIPNVSNLINKSKKDSRESNEKTLLMAGKSYMQANNGELKAEIIDPPADVLPVCDAKAAAGIPVHMNGTDIIHTGHRP